MLTLDLKSIFDARGIDKPYAFLVKKGFTPSAAKTLVSGTAANVKMRHIEKLCILLWCSPNDLFYWQPQTDTVVTEDHPLLPLQKRPAAALNLKNAIRHMPLNKLGEVSALLTNKGSDPKKQ